MGISMKKVKGYLVSVLVFYTVMVTYFLLQTIWNDELALAERGGRHDNKLINVLYQEERRHIRSFKDVVHSYGGLLQFKIREITTPAKAHQNTSFATLNASMAKARTEKGHDKSTYFYVEGADAKAKGFRTTTASDAIFDEKNIVDVGPKPQLATSKFDANPEEIQQDFNSNLDNVKSKQSGNIIIETFTTNSTFNVSKSKRLLSQSHSSKSINFKLDYLHNTHDIADSKIAKPGDNNNYTNGAILTQYCDKLDAEEPHLCLSEHVTFSHQRHINITSNHMSFKSLGDIHIYSAFLDTRNPKAVAVRILAMGPKDRDLVKTSGYWCAYSLPPYILQQNYWNGRGKPLVLRPDQATQMSYYAASVGHNRPLQFYIMSCAVPDRHLAVLTRFETTRIHLVMGRRNSSLLDVIQERIALDVINNQGRPWQLVVSQSQSPQGTSILQEESLHRNEKIQSQEAIIQNASFQKSSPQSVPKSNHNSSRPIPDSIVSCVAPIFGSLGIVQLVEFIELTLMLGSQHIVLYLNRASNDTRDVLNLYRRQGLITVLPWTLTNTTSIWASGRDIALNDCLYRTMHRYEYALFHDMDEFFVPRVTPDLPSFINFLNSKGGLKQRISDIVFTSAYFVPPSKLQLKYLANIPGYTKEVSKFSTLRSVHRTYFNNSHSLRIIRPALAHRVGAGERKKAVFTVSSRFAAVNHYSNCAKRFVAATDNNPKVTDQDGASNRESSPNMKKEQINNKSNNGCTATKMDTHLWSMKRKLIHRTKQSIIALNAKRHR